MVNRGTTNKAVRFRKTLKELGVPLGISKRTPPTSFSAATGADPGFFLGGVHL